MFSHRRRTSTGIHLPKHHHQPQATPSSTAATAATTAFLSRRNPDATLSAAAAATALRSHPASPTSVSSLQTKRIQQKSSQGSIQRARSASPHKAELLERSPSNTSLSERTLRSPSPGRAPTSTSANVPPVPAIPPQLSASPGRPRASSLESPMKTYLPAAMPEGRAGSLDGRSRHSTQTMRSRAPRLPQVEELSRESSRRSVNFSRPMSPQTSSPSSPLPTSRKPGWHSGPVVTGNLPRHDPPSVRSAIAAPVPKSHATGSAAFLVPSYEQPAIGPPPHIPASQLVSGGLGASRWSTSSQPKEPQLPQKQSLTTKTISAPAANPAPVAESARAVAGDVDKKEPVHSAITQTEADLVVAPTQFTQEPQHHEAIDRDHLSSQSPVVTENRKASPSPARSAHFDGSGSIIGNGIKHAPPGRTASPAKSALKTAHPDHQHPHSTIHISAPESDASSTTTEPKRKKTVRINLEVVPDEDPRGLQASRYAPPTPVKHHSNFEEDIDTISQPTPALPAFESVRGQNRDNLESSSDHKLGALSHGLKHNQTSTADHSDKSAITRQSLLAGKGARREDVESRPVERPEDSPLLPEENSTSADENQTGRHLTPIAEIGPEISAPAPSESQKHSRDPGVPPPSETRDWAIPGAFPETPSWFDEEFTSKVTSSTAAIPSPPQADKIPSLRTDADESSDEESVYEDAEEELGGGFASLNAIMEESTPDDISKVSKAITIESMRPLVSQDSVDTLALENRLEEARLNSQEHGTPPKGSQVLPTVSADQPQKVPSEVRQAPSPSPSPKPQKSLGASKWSPSNAPTAAGANFKKRNATQSPPRAQAGRSQAPKTQSKEIFGTPILKRSDSADSVSSFKRNRASSPRDKNRMSLRQSLRGSNTSSTASPSAHRHESLMRAGSPESLSSPKMRSSLRDGLPQRAFSNDETALRRAKSPSRLSGIFRYKPKFGRSEKKQQTPIQQDRDDDIPRKQFVSRFADSDDELDSPRLQPPIELAPVRGIPHRRGQDDADSTDLDDSDESPPEVPPVPSVSDVDKTHQEPVTKGSTVTTGPGKLDTGLASSKYAPKTPTGHKRWQSLLHMGQSRPTTRDSFTTSSPTVAGSDASPKSSKRLRKSPPTSQFKGASEEDWPLGELPPPRYGVFTDERPFSADGPKPKSKRIDMGKRRTTADEILIGQFQKETANMQDSDFKEIQTNGVSGVADEPTNSEIALPEKDRKKRFSRFRRMVGMKK